MARSLGGSVSREPGGACCRPRPRQPGWRRDIGRERPPICPGRSTPARPRGSLTPNGVGVAGERQSGAPDRVPSRRRVACAPPVWPRGSGLANQRQTDLHGGGYVSDQAEDARQASRAVGHASRSVAAVGGGRGIEGIRDRSPDRSHAHVECEAPTLTQAMVNNGGRSVFVERQASLEAVAARTLELQDLTVGIESSARAFGEEISEV